MLEAGDDEPRECDSESGPDAEEAEEEEEGETDWGIPNFVASQMRDIIGDFLQTFSDCRNRQRGKLAFASTNALLTSLLLRSDQREPVRFFPFAPLPQQRQRGSRKRTRPRREEARTATGTATTRGARRWTRSAAASSSSTGRTA